MGQADARVLDKSQIRDAASVILVRKMAEGPAILMGQRGKTAAFMPSKFVFPGGAVDEVDATIPLARQPLVGCAEALSALSNLSAQALIAAATRELWEETGLLLGRPASEADDEALAAPPGWRGYLATGMRPDGAAMRFVFRAITPPGRPRRFDARFFLVDAEALRSVPDDFSGAEDELSHLQWVPLSEARSFDMPFITEVVLAEIAAHLEGRNHPGVPFFDNSGEESRFERL